MAWARPSARGGRPTEREILICRLTDRPIRPLFPEGFYNEVQVVATVMSVTLTCDHRVVDGVEQVAFTTAVDVTVPTAAEDDADATLTLTTAGDDVDAPWTAAGRPFDPAGRGAWVDDRFAAADVVADPTSVGRPLPGVEVRIIEIDEDELEG